MANLDTTTRILDLLKELPFRDRIEVLANVFIRLGLQAIEYKDPSIVPDQLNRSALLSFAAQYKKQYGETFEGAILFQGLTLLMWLHKER